MHNIVTVFDASVYLQRANMVNFMLLYFISKNTKKVHANRKVVK